MQNIHVINSQIVAKYLGLCPDILYDMWIIPEWIVTSPWTVVRVFWWRGRSRAGSRRHSDCGYHVWHKWNVSDGQTQCFQSWQLLFVGECWNLGLQTVKCLIKAGHALAFPDVGRTSLRRGDDALSLGFHRRSRGGRSGEDEAGLPVVWHLESGVAGCWMGSLMGIWHVMGHSHWVLMTVHPIISWRWRRCIMVHLWMIHPAAKSIHIEITLWWHALCIKHLECTLSHVTIH